MDSNTQPISNSEDQEFAQLLLLIWDKKYLILGITVLSTILGVLYALNAPAIYFSQATITTKESSKSNDASGLLSQLGGVGGAVVGQLGIGNANLDKMEIILRSHNLAKQVIQKHNLLPKLYPKIWDNKLNRWNNNDSTKIPSLQQGINILRLKMLIVSLDQRKKIIKVGIEAESAELSKEIVDIYLKELNNKIKKEAFSSSKENRMFLEQQLSQTTDPLLEEKIRAMIALEIEKVMFIGTQSFDILEDAIVPYERAKPNKRSIVMVAFFIGLIISITGTLLQNFIQKIIKQKSIIPQHS